MNQIEKNDLYYSLIEIYEKLEHLKENIKNGEY